MKPQVIRALEKAGWRVASRPVYIKLVGKRGYIYADVRFERADEQIIVVEVKCFTHVETWLEELYRAIGQYLLYRNALYLQNVDYPLYLTVPLTAYNRLVQWPAVQATIQDARIKLIVVDLEREEVAKWDNS